MSRHVIETGNRYEVIVGWDAPMGTFFGQVFGPPTEDGEDNMVARIGYEMRQVTSVDEIVLWVEEQGFTVPPATREALVSASNEPWTPGPLQKMLGFTGKEG